MNAMTSALTLPETVQQQVERIRQQNAVSLLPAPMAELKEMASMLAGSGYLVPKHFRGNEDACLAIAYQATRWAMDPVAVAKKAYLAGEQIGYEAQLVASLINTRAPLVGRLDITFAGEGQSRYCVVRGRLEGAAKDAIVTSPVLGAIKPKNSPLWHTDPDQQLAYYTQRAWARRHCPEVLLGVYTPDEIQAMTVIDVTPKQLASVYDDDAPLPEVEGELMAEGERAASPVEPFPPEIVAEAEEITPEPSGGFTHKGTADSQGRGAKDIGPDPWANAESVEEWYSVYREALEKADNIATLDKLGQQAVFHGWFTKLGQAEGKEGAMKKTLTDIGKAKREELKASDGETPSK